MEALCWRFVRQTVNVSRALFDVFHMVSEVHWHGTFGISRLFSYPTGGGSCLMAWGALLTLCLSSLIGAWLTVYLALECYSHCPPCPHWHYAIVFTLRAAFSARPSTYWSGATTIGCVFYLFVLRPILSSTVLRFRTRTPTCFSGAPLYGLVTLCCNVRDGIPQCASVLSWMPSSCERVPMALSNGSSESSSPYSVESLYYSTAIYDPYLFWLHVGSCVSMSH